MTGTRIRREATPATVNLRRCKLVVIKGAQRGTEFVIAGDVIRIGKAPENDLVLADETVYAYAFEGRRFDCGSKLGYLQATVEFALKHTNLGPKFGAYLEDFVAHRMRR